TRYGIIPVFRPPGRTQRLSVRTPPAEIPGRTLAAGCGLYPDSGGSVFSRIVMLLAGGIIGLPGGGAVRGSRLSWVIEIIGWPAPVDRGQQRLLLQEARHDQPEHQ